VKELNQAKKSYNDPQKRSFEIKMKFKLKIKFKLKLRNESNIIKHSKSCRR
jgi:hypothetical protein